MDVVASDAKHIEHKLGKGDRQKMDQYFTSVRNFEKRRSRPGWATRSKPKVNAEPPVDIENSDAIIDRKKLMLDACSWLCRPTRPGSSRFPWLARWCRTD